VVVGNHGLPWRVGFPGSCEPEGKGCDVEAATFGCPIAHVGSVEPAIIVFGAVSFGDPGSDAQGVHFGQERVVIYQRQ